MNVEMDRKGMGDNCTEVGKLKDVLTNNNEPVILSCEIPRCCQSRTSDVTDSVVINIPLSQNGRRGSMTGTSPSGGGCSSSCSSSHSLVKPPKHKRRRLADSVDVNVMVVEEEPNDKPESLPIKEAWMPVDKYSDEYNMNHLRRGLVVIFNNEDFDSSEEKRKGSDIDVESLTEVFTDLRFDIEIHHNKSRDEIKDILEETAKRDHTDADCIIVIVLSHGKGSKFLWARDDIYRVDSLWPPFMPDKCPTLAGKPKLFFIQACRGYDYDSGVVLSRESRTERVLSSESHASFPSDLTSVEGLKTGEKRSKKRSQQEMNLYSESYKIPIEADFLVAFSCVEGFYSFRDPASGSWFIQSLCEELKQNAHDHDLLSLLTNVSRRVAVDYESYNKTAPWKHEKKQVPEITTKLIRKVYFRPRKSVPFKKAYISPKK